MPIHHIVLVKFNEGITQEQKDSWAREAEKLGSLIQEAKGIKAGKKIPHVHDQGYESGLFVVFDSLQDYEVYLPHPAHTAFKEFAAPLVKDRLIFDVEV